MSTPPEHHATPDAAPADMVRVCDRCGTVCSADQEWCLNCGVRMTEASQSLPGLRAAGLVVALAVLLAGGAAAASYAALRGDARSAANVPADTTGAPVAQAPPATTPVAPAAPVTPVPTTPTTPTTTAKKAPATPAAPAAPAAPATPPATGGSTGGGSTGGSGGSGGGSTDTGSGGSGGSNGSGGSGGSGGGTTTTTEREPTGPVVFATGQGTIYDPSGAARDKGDEGNAIDERTGTSWKVVLNEGQTGGLGYVLDFDDPTALKRLTVNTSTAGLKVKVLATTRTALPPDELDAAWDTVAGERTMKDGRNAIPLKAVSGAKSKYRHVLVLFTSVPGDPATVSIREFAAST